MRPRLLLAAAGLLLSACGPSGSGGDAAQLFARECASCHGQDGRGHPGRRGLEPLLDLTRSPLARAGQNGLVFQRIALGFGTMPGFSHKLAQGDLELLAEYVRELARTDPPTAP